MKGIVLNRINIIMIDTAEFSNPLFWVDVGISCIIIALVMFVTCFFLRRKLPIIIVSCGCALILISKFLGLNLGSNALIGITTGSIPAKIGYIIIVITNQRSVPKQIYDLIHNYMLEKLPEIDSIYVCPHENGECDCRKPFPGLFYQAESKYNVDKNNSVIIKNNQSDIDAATNYGIKSYLTTDLYSIVKEYV